MLKGVFLAALVTHMHAMLRQSTLIPFIPLYAASCCRVLSIGIEFGATKTKGHERLVSLCSRLLGLAGGSQVRSTLYQILSFRYQQHSAPSKNRDRG